jgi:hypothetical protein
MSVLAVLVWRPAVEEWQYRSMLNKVLFAPRVIQTSLHKLSKMAPSVGESAGSVVQFIPINDKTPQPQFAETADNDPIDHDPQHESNSNGRFNRAITLPFPNESARILMGSILFATTRLGWLSTDPAAGYISSSPYSWTIGFLQSLLAHFSSSVLPEIRPGLRRWILLLGIHQTVSTYLVAQFIFANLYRERGLAASVGAHVTWTVGKGTIVFRLLWRFWKWCSNFFAMARSVDQSNPSRMASSSEKDTT